MNASETLRSAWRQQAEWSLTASRLKAAIKRERLLILALVVFTAILETLAAQLTTQDYGIAARATAIAGAVLMALAAFLQGWSRSEGNVDKWVRARATSEALKEQVFRYLSATGRYASQVPEAILREEIDKILNDVKDLQLVVATADSPTRELPPVNSLDEYVSVRVEGQMKSFYRPRARELAYRRNGWQRTQTVLMASTAGLGAIVAYLPGLGLGAWIAVLTTMAGALGAHVGALRYDHLIVSYRATASRLESLRNEWRDILSKKDLTTEQRTDFVNRCEDAMSVENQAWLAGWAKQVKAKGSS